MAREENNYPVRQFRALEVGEQIIIGADPADSQDFCAAIAISKKHLDCPIIYNSIQESSQFGYELNNLAKHIHNETQMWPKIAVEKNVGLATIYVLKELNYPDLFRMVDFSATSSHEGGGIGWNTTGHWSAGELGGSRRKMLDDMALAIRQGILKMYDPEQIKQFKSFMNVRGRAQAKSGKKDDLVMATGIAWEVQSITPSVYLDNFDVEAFHEEQQKWRFK